MPSYIPQKETRPHEDIYVSACDCPSCRRTRNGALVSEYFQPGIMRNYFPKHYVAILEDARADVFEGAIRARMIPAIDRIRRDIGDRFLRSLPRHEMRITIRMETEMFVSGMARAIVASEWLKNSLK